MYLVPDLDLMKIVRHTIHQDTSGYTGYIDEMLYPDACYALLRLVALRAPPCAGEGVFFALIFALAALGAALEEPASWRNLPWQRVRAPPSPSPRPRPRPRPRPLRGGARARCQGKFLHIRFLQGGTHGTQGEEDALPPRKGGARSATSRSRASHASGYSISSMYPVYHDVSLHIYPDVS